MDEDKLRISAVSADLAQSVHRRLCLWGVRWVIGFCVIALIVYWVPRLSWLWWAGGVVAALSLVTTLVMHFILRRKIAAVQSSIAEMDRLVAESDQAVSGGGSS
jgi:divalent metal cation (Fe/Co/Zn/Cd) transporter